MSEFMDDLVAAMEKAQPSSLAARLDRERPYSGQAHTHDGERGRTPIQGLTYRDLMDCCFRGAYDASGLPPSEWPGDVYQLPWPDMDPVAVFQNICCWVERYQGIFPNVPGRPA